MYVIYFIIIDKVKNYKMFCKLVFYDNKFYVFFLFFKVMRIEIVFVFINYIWVNEDINIVLVKWIECFWNVRYEFNWWLIIVFFYINIEDVYDDYYGRWIIDEVFNVYGLLLVKKKVLFYIMCFV